MPITQIATFTPLSQGWTHQQVVSEAMVLTNTIDNEKIQLDNIRNHMNSSISYIAHLLNISHSPWYGIYMIGTLETTLHPTGLEWIDLSVVLNQTVPSQVWSQIKRLSVIATNPADPATTDWIGNGTKLDLSQLAQLQSRQNIQWRHSVAWSHHGSEIIVLVGQGITTAARTQSGSPYDMTDQTIGLWGWRKPMLDALTSPNVLTNNNYYGNVDLPDEHIELLIKMVQKKILEQLREQVPAQLDQEINQGLLTITQNLQAELQFEASEREKRKYGEQQRAPGAM